MLLDLSLSVGSETNAVPGFSGFEAEPVTTFEADGKLSHRFSANTHLGTHVDAPAHFVDGGTTIDQVEPSRFVGPARVLDLRTHRGDPITADILARTAPNLNHKRVILLTGDVDAGYTDPDFFETASALTEDAAEWLLDAGVTLLANDFLTESFTTPARPVHELLLGEEMVLVEYICNSDSIADARTVQIYCQPLKLAGMEAAPARVLARTDHAR